MRGRLLLPEMLDLLERRFWLDLWRVPVLDAFEEDGIEARLYGPIIALVTASAPRIPSINLMLGAGELGAVARGHLGEAIEWIESLGVDCRIPIDPRRPEAGAAEEFLNQRGYRRESCLLRFVRGTDVSDLPQSDAFEIDEWTEETEGFNDYIEAGFDLGNMASDFFIGMPGRRQWRCFVAIDEEELGAGAATMRIEDDIALLAFGSVLEDHRRRGCHTELLRRRIAEAGQPGPYAPRGCFRVFAHTEELLDELEDPSPATCSLRATGFTDVSMRPIWQPPEDSLSDPLDPLERAARPFYI